MDNVVLDQKQIAEILPQAYPFIMIDRVIEFEKDKSLVAVKNITGNEWVFQGQADKTDVFPETLVIEAALQAALVLYHLNKIKEGEKRPKYVLGKIKADFDGAVLIGDQIEIKAYANKVLDTGGYSDIDVKKNGKPIVRVEIIYSVIR
ncbi:MAG: 3-hydroxyacyl-[acyl-carrier-protein] dehydratase FabZ [Candidatus Omnitrophica bacterium]|nr:3-hydroxyacyl-[acyl-carrier-protein] dehydratase FabZ [Candidatus Omnitrophota bacterium]